MSQMIRGLIMGLALFIGTLANQAVAQTPQQVKGIGWTASTTVAPALATDGNNGYIAWVDSATSNVYYATYGSGGWYNPQPVSGTNTSGGTWTAQSDAAPAWGYDGSFFYLFWKGKGGNKIWFSSMTSEGDWTLQSVVKGSSWTAETNVAPAATFTGWPVTLYWQGMSADTVWTSSFDDLAPGWTTQQVVKGWATNVAPCVESSPSSSDNPAVFLKAATDNGMAGFVSSTGDPVSGSGWTAETTQSPAAVLDVGGQDLVLWTGQTGTSIWYSHNTGTPIGLGGSPKWSKQATVTGAKTYLAPAVAQANGSSGFISLLAWKNASDDAIWYLANPKLP